MEIILKKLYQIRIILIFFIFLNTLLSQEIADKQEMDIYMELLKTSGEILYLPSQQDLQISIKNYISELLDHKKNLSEFYNILEKLGYIENNIMEMEFRNYKEHFFERKEMEIFTEFLKIEWENKVPKTIIFRSKSSIMPYLNTKNTVFVLPLNTIMDHNQEQEPTIKVLAKISYQAGQGEEYYFILPPIYSETNYYKEEKKTIRIFDFQIGNVSPKIINDPRLKIITYQYIIYRLRYLDLKLRSIIRNKLRKNMFDFYKSIPDSRY